MASILKVKDENGQIIEIPALRGKKGDDGVGIKSIAKTSTSGLIDTYTITLADGRTSTFTVKNGEDGENVINAGIPTKVSQLDNDSGYITLEDVPEVNVPIKVSELENDSKYITNADLPDIPTKTSELENDSGFITSENIPEFPEVPTKVSELENDTGYITVDDISEMPEVNIEVDQTYNSESENAQSGKAVKEAIDNKFTTQAENEEPIYGDELANAEGWTIDGWTGDFANGFTHTSGNTTPLVFTMPEETGANTYRISFNCSEAIAVEALMVKCGNSDLFDLYGQKADPITLGIVSVENGNVEFVPASTFEGTVTDISIKRVIGFNPTEQTIIDSTSEISCEMRTTKSSLNNVFIGKYSGEDNISGRGCVAVGSSALQNNTSGFWNVGIGLNALKSNTVGSRNIGIGYIALNENVTGTRNIAIGTFALNHNKTGNKNIAIGADALDKNISGSQNVAIGLQSLYSNTIGESNVAVGSKAMSENTTGRYNFGLGAEALAHNTTGSYNIGIGGSSLYRIKTKNYNTGVGFKTLYGCNEGMGNTAIGFGAGMGNNGTFKNGVFIGKETGSKLTTGADYNTFIGFGAGQEVTTGANNICIGQYAGTPTETTSNWVNIGGLYEGSRNASDKYAKINGGLQLSDLPTSDPAIAGRVWNDNGVLKVSMG